MNKEVAISVTNVSKNFKVPHEKHNTLKSKAIHIFSSNKFSKYKALENINFEVEKGDFFGIVGKNGCGKSTLLKIIASIYQPTRGNIEVNGTIAPFIELGVGFNPELTGRENVFLSGTILGLSRKRIEQLYDEIVNFAELSEFMDQKLKNYSSGMQVRLAFSIAIRAESEILLIDEVLAVGDVAFQEKCFDEFNKLKMAGKTIILVTHDMTAINRFCNKAILISNGEIIDKGTPSKITARYNQLNDYEINNDLIKTKVLKSFKLIGSNNKEKTVFNFGENIRLQLKFNNGNSKVRNVGVALFKNDGVYCFGSNTILDNYKLKPGQEMIEYIIKQPTLLPGTYLFKVGLSGDTDNKVIEFIDQLCIFKVKTNSKIQYGGVVTLEHTWI